MNKLRLFLAIDTPPDVRPGVAAIRDDLKRTEADVKWESDEKLHCTVKFLGDTDPGLVPRIIEVLEEAARGTPAVDAVYRGVGCFPNSRDPRVIWVGMEDITGNLQELHRRIDARLSGLGFEREQRAFHPHVTLGRVKGRRNLHQLLGTLETITFESRPVSLRSVELVKSELKPSGSVYTILKSIPLNA